MAQTPFPPDAYRRKFVGATLSLVLGAPAFCRAAGDSAAPAKIRRWPSEIPRGCPAAKSTDHVGLGFTGRFVTLGKADTWYPSWGADDRLYSPFTDGEVTTSGSGGGVTTKAFSGGAQANVGYAVLSGEDPFHLSITEAGVIPGSPAPYGGRYPCACLHKDGVWYLGTYAVNTASYGLNWPICGPFAGFHISKDGGKTWTPSPHSCAPGQGLFPEPTQINGPVKFGVPHVVDFGKNMEGSPDGMMYLVAHGSLQQDGEDRKANLSWTTGDQIYLCRAKPTPETINDPAAYEYFGGRDSTGKSAWTKDLPQAKPILDWNNFCGGATITWNKPLQKFFMCVTNGGDTMSPYDSYVLESDRIEGPWKIVTYMKNFGVQGYFLNIPSKFISKDGRSFWLCYSANWANPFIKRKFRAMPAGSSYTMTMQEVHLLAPGEISKTPVLDGAGKV